MGRMASQRMLGIVALLLLQFSAVKVTNSTGSAVTVGHQGPHISSLNLLLPPRTTRPVQVRLYGFNGCFTWAWDHHDVLHVEPDFNATVKHCATSAVLTSIAAYSSRRATAVHAKDVFTGQILRCEVFIDKISRIRIFHHSLKLDLDGVATLRIRAFDTEENVFSSLVGLQFMWQLAPVNPSGEYLAHRLIHVPLKDTALEDSEIETQIELEQTGLDSDLYVVRGISAGQERVTAQLMEPLSEHLIDVIVLTVAEAFSLDPPSPIYIIPGTHLQYTLKTLRRNIATVVSLPSAHHEWFTSNSSVAEIHSSTGLVVGRTHGVTTVVVKDTRVVGHEQTSTLYVVTPLSLRLYLTPLFMKGAGQNSLIKEPPIMSSDIPWQLVVGRKYVVQVFTFSRESGTQPLLLTKDNDLRRMYANQLVWLIDDVPEAIASEQGWQNCSLLHALKEGSGTLVATLAHGSMLHDTSGNWLSANKEVLREEQKVMVCSQVRIAKLHSDENSALLLPWISGHGQEYQLLVEGGCGERPADYWWLSSNPEVASVNALGVVKAGSLGKAVIRVGPVRDPLNYDEVVVDVSMPASIDVVPGLPVEVEVPSSLPVAVTLRNPGGKRYSQCDSFSSLVEWQVVGGDSFFVQIQKTSEIFTLLELKGASPCSWSLLQASKAGRATVTAMLNFQNLLPESESLASSQRLLEISWAIAAYVPLWLEQIGDGNSYGGYTFRGDDVEAPLDGTVVPHEGLKELLLVVGSSMRIIVQGGPERWRQGVEFVDSILDATGETVAASEIAITHLSEGAGRLYTLTCAALGNHTLGFYRGNLVGNDHPTRSVASVSLSVLCAVPTSLALLIDEPENKLALIKSAVQADRNANRVRTAPFTVINAQTIRVSAVALVGGRPFANASSLYLKWVLKGCYGLAEWQSPNRPGWIDEGPWECLLRLGHGSGECTVEASAGGLVASKFLSHSTLFNVMDTLAAAKLFLRDAAPLQLVSALRLEPKLLILFLHPDAKATFLVMGGTSDVESHIHDSRVAVLSHQPPTAGLLHLIVGAKGIGTTLLTVRDVGLATPSEAIATVLVTDVAWVKMLIPEDASLLLGSNMTVHLEAGDEAGHAFEPSQFKFMKVKVRAQDDIVEVIRLPKSSGAQPSANAFVIRGANVGLTSTLHVSVQRHTGQEITSDFGKIAVFAPLSIHPPSLVIAPGGQFVFTARGGPRVGASVDFLSSDSNIATIEKTSGLLKAISPGNLTIYAQARSPGDLVITEDSVKVRVQLHFMPVLNVRGGQLGVNREMSIFPTAVEEDLLSFIELCYDYKWSIADDQVLFFRHAEFAAGGSSEGKFYGQSGIADRPGGLSSHMYGYDGNVGTEEGFSARIVGKSAGRTTVTVSFTCQFGSGDGNMEPRLYTASDTIWVVPPPPLALGIPATWLLRPQYTSSSLLPQWTEHFPARTTTEEMHMWKNVVYTVMHEGSSEHGVISIGDDGKIRTTERLEVACIHARDRNTGRAEIAACIRVAEVAQVMVGGDDFPYHVAELSVGSNQHYVVKLADEFGSPFFEAGRGVSLLMLETNRADIVSIKVSDCEHQETTCSLSISVQALRQGTALVRVSFKGLPQIVDFILIKVGAFVNPRNPSVHIGGRVNFTVIGKGFRAAGGSKGDRGRWTSDNINVLEIDSHTGHAKAVGEGTAIVSFSGSHLTTYTSTTVVKIDTVAIKAPANSGQLTNTLQEEGYRFPVKFSDSQGYDVGILGESQEVSYECRPEPSFLGLAVAWREPGSATFFCVFFPHPPLDIYRQEDSQKLLSSAGGSNGTTQLRIVAVVPGRIPAVGSVDVTFVGGFEIVNTPEQLHLSPTTNKSLITVIGNTGQIKVSWQRTDVMVVKKVSESRVTSGLADRVVYEVKLSAEDQPFTDKILFSLPTGQKAHRVVTYSAEFQSASLLAKPILTAVVLVVALLVLPLIFCARLLDLPRTRDVRHDGTESVSDTVLCSPGEQTPPPTKSSFDHTPPPHPYTDYISRTIEKTPYLRREGFRRFDPSRTY